MSENSIFVEDKHQVKDITQYFIKINAILRL